MNTVPLEFKDSVCQFFNSFMCRIGGHNYNVKAYAPISGIHVQLGPHGGIRKQPGCGDIICYDPAKPQNLLHFAECTRCREKFVDGYPATEKQLISVLFTTYDNWLANIAKITVGQLSSVPPPKGAITTEIVKLPKHRSIDDPWDC